MYTDRFRSETRRRIGVYVFFARVKKLRAFLRVRSFFQSSYVFTKTSFTEKSVRQLFSYTVLFVQCWTNAQWFLYSTARSYSLAKPGISGDGAFVYLYSTNVSCS